MGNRFGFVAAVGGFSNFVERYRQCNPPTPMDAIRLGLGACAGVLLHNKFGKALFHPFQVDFADNLPPALVSEAKGSLVDLNTLSASVVENLSFGFRPYGRMAGMPPDIFKVLMCLGDARRLLPFLPELYFGIKTTCPSFYRQDMKKLDVTLNQSQQLMIDGDIFGAVDRFCVQTVKPLKFINTTPAKSLR